MDCKCFQYYTTFGSPMPTRTWSDPNSKYKYGFNGKEKDNEVTVDGGDYDFGARIYDSRLGRFLSLDPLQMKYPNVSPYTAMGNNPMFFIDVDGREILNGYDKVTQKELYIKVQKAIEIVKLTMPELYARVNANPKDIVIKFSQLSAYVEPKPEPIPDGGTTTFNNNTTEVSSDEVHNLLGKCSYTIKSTTGNKVTYKRETVNGVETVKYYNTTPKMNGDVVETDSDGRTIYNEPVEITAEEANSLLVVKSIGIEMTNGITSTYLLGETLAHELTHADDVLNNTVMVDSQDKLKVSNADCTSEANAAKSEEAYEKSYTFKKDKKANEAATAAAQ